MNSTKTKSNLERIWLLWQTQTQGQIGDTHLRSDHTTHTTAVSKLCPLWRQPPPSSPRLNCKGCVFQDLCIILQKQLNMEPHLGLVMSGSAAKFVPLQRKGSEIAQKCWSQFCEGLHVKQVGVFFVVFFFSACLAAFNVTFERQKTRAELGETATKGPLSSTAPFPHADLNLLHPLRSLQHRYSGFQSGDAGRRNAHLQKETPIGWPLKISPLFTRLQK